MKTFADMHTHSEFSCDSEEKIADICKAAISKGLIAICITDHIDYNPNDYGFDYYKKDEYLYDLNLAKENFKDELLVLSGIEFSEPHIYADKLSEFQKMDYDVILGSIHWLDSEFVGQKELLEKYPQIDVEEIYYDMVLKSIEHGGFDVLAHLDFPKRYYGSTLIGNNVLLQILEHLVKNNIALEINTSSLRKGLHDSMPSLSIIEEYINLGGRMLTLGSDAHVVSDIASDFESIISQLSETAINSIGVFKSRKFTRIKDIIT